MILCFHNLQRFLPCSWTLIGTAINWFIIDVTFYGQGLFNNQVLSSAGASADKNTDNITYLTNIVCCSAGV